MKTQQSILDNLQLNPFYRGALAADFSRANNEEDLNQSFSKALKELVSVIVKEIESVTSVTAITETFHYSILAAALLRRKAIYQREEILKAAPPEYSVETMVMTQLGAMDENPDDDDDKYNKSRGRAEIRKIAEAMNCHFEYTGRAMRAMIIVSVLADFACSENKMYDPVYILKSFTPTSLLMSANSDTCGEFPVIGKLEDNRRGDLLSKLSAEASMITSSTTAITRIPENEFCGIFRSKLTELLSLERMDIPDRARLEEMRAFYADTLCRSFFFLRHQHFPRVLHLVSAVSSHCDEKGRISEQDLYKIVPVECKELLNRESILIKDSMDLGKVWYRVNTGVKSFAELIGKLNLFDSRIQALMEDVMTGLPQ